MTLQRDLPIGIMGSLLVCVVLYVGVCLVITGMVPYMLLGEDAPLAEAFTSKGLKYVSILISIGAVAGLITTLLVGLYVQVNIQTPMYFTIFRHIASAVLMTVFLINSLGCILGLEGMVYYLQYLLKYTQNTIPLFILRSGLVSLLAYWQDYLTSMSSHTFFQWAHWYAGANFGL